MIELTCQHDLFQVELHKQKSIIIKPIYSQTRYPLQDRNYRAAFHWLNCYSHSSLAFVLCYIPTLLGFQMNALTIISFLVKESLSPSPRQYNVTDLVPSRLSTKHHLLLSTFYIFLTSTSPKSLNMPEWKNGLCSCFGNIPVCALTYIVPCYVYGKTAEKVNIYICRTSKIKYTHHLVRYCLGDYHLSIRVH